MGGNSPDAVIQGGTVIELDVFDRVLNFCFC